MTKKRVTVEELYRYAVEDLHLDFIFWGTEEPYYTEEVLPFLTRSALVRVPRAAPPALR